MEKGFLYNGTSQTSDHGHICRRAITSYLKDQDSPRGKVVLQVMWVQSQKSFKGNLLHPELHLDTNQKPV